jgi:hypothetical protein
LIDLLSKFVDFNKESVTNNIQILAIDIAKNVFQLHGNDKHGHCLLKKRLTRAKFPEFIANMPDLPLVFGSKIHKELGIINGKAKVHRRV